MPNEINYYIFDRIEQQVDGTYQAYLGGKSCEVFSLDEDDDDDETLIAKGFAKCDAPGTETFVVSESDLQEDAEGNIEIVNDEIEDEDEDEDDEDETDDGPTVACIGIGGFHQLMNKLL